MQNQGIKKIVLAYSGGLDTSAIIPWLKENYGGCEVVAFVADIGQERSDLEGVEQKALQSGASECHVVDLREEFIRDYVYPVLQTAPCMRAATCWAPRWRGRSSPRRRSSWR